VVAFVIPVEWDDACLRDIWDEIGSHQRVIDSSRSSNVCRWLVLSSVEICVRVNELVLFYPFCQFAGVSLRERLRSRPAGGYH
jgi:hypothetical protein